MSVNVKKILKYAFNSNYRFIIRANRGKLAHMDDKTFLCRKYKVHTGRKLNIDDPKTFNEKLQWMKLYDRKPVYTEMVDKFEAKKYVADLIGEEYIIPTYGVWDSFEEINFDELPDSFVLKCTHDSGGLVIVRDKSRLDIARAGAKIKKSLANDYYAQGREWPYKDVKPRIIAEAYMENADGSGLRDYKFYCFGGVPKFLYISEGLEDHSTAKISFVTCDWKKAPYERSDFRPFDELPQKPEHFEEMLKLASRLAEGMRFLRVDLYEINGRIYFSELTFFPCSGYMPFKNQLHDAEIGEMLDITDVE